MAQFFYQVLGCKNGIVVNKKPTIGGFTLIFKLFLTYFAGQEKNMNCRNNQTPGQNNFFCIFLK